MFRISRTGSNEITDVAQFDEIEPAVRVSEPGRYNIDQIERDPLPSGHTSSWWGVGIKRHGTVAIEPDPWDA
jgi:hypothetical protein